MNSDEQYWTTPAGRRLCYAAFGDPDGTPLFFFHGWPSSRLQGHMLDAEARRLGLRVISPDRPGLGRSDYTGKRTLAQWPEIIAGLADHLGFPSFRVIGVSGGGPYALACAAWLPDRARRVSIVCGAPPLAEFPDRSDMLWAYRSLLRVRRFAPGVLAGIIRLSGKFSRLPTHRPPMSWMLKSIPPVDRAAVEDSGGYAAYMRSFQEGIRQGGRGVIEDAEVYLDDWKLDFPSIRVPVVFWHGALDGNIPIRMAKQLAARIPGAQTHWLDHEGHYSLPLRQVTRILEDIAAA